MSRLQKKCFIGATGMHVFLLLLLVVGPAFISSDKVDDSPVLEFRPMILTDDKLSNPGATAPRATPQPQPQPQVQPPPPQPQPQVRQPDPPKIDVPKVTKPDPDAIEAKPTPKRHQPQVSDRIVKIPRDVKTPSRPTTSTANNQRQQEVAKVIKNIKGNLSQTTTVEMPEGPGGGSGPSYANYAQEVRRVYTQAWSIPSDVDDDEATVKVSVVIARSGQVVSSRITQSSGSPAVDRSIQATLDRVTFVAPFPAGAKDSQRTFIISFSLKAKKLLG